MAEAGQTEPHAIDGISVASIRGGSPKRPQLNALARRNAEARRRLHKRASSSVRRYITFAKATTGPGRSHDSSRDRQALRRALLERCDNRVGVLR